MAMRAADVFNYLKQQNVIRNGTGSDDSCSTQSEGYSPPLPPFVQGPKTRCVSDKGGQDHSVEETVLPQTTQGVHIRLQGTSRCLIGDCAIPSLTYDDSTHVSETSSPSILSDTDDALPSHLFCFENDSDLCSSDDQTTPARKKKRARTPDSRITRDITSSTSILSDADDALPSYLYCFENDSDLCSSDDPTTPARKKKRARTPDSKITRDIKKHPLRPACQPTCRLKCSTKIDQQHREGIHIAFWNLDYNSRKNFASQRIERFATERHRPRARTDFEGRRRKNESRKYTLLDKNGESTQVCKTFFLNTLGFTSDKFITTLSRTTSPGAATPPPDKRGKHEPPNKTNSAVMEAINHHIESFHPTVPHYRRSHAPLRRYLPDDISITSMWKDFKEKNAESKVSFNLYRQCVRNKNISFSKLGGEECELCLLYNTECHGHVNQQQPSCELCEQWAQHIEHARKSRTQYQEDGKASSGEGETVYLSSDMQKIIVLPRMPGVKTCMFTRRLVVFHQTFAPLGHLKSKRREHRVLACVWHEGITGRKAADVASAYAKAIEYYSQSTDSIVIWCDNCGPQNKNWTLYTCLTLLMNSPSVSLTQLELRYLEKGHTFMSADSFHASVEKSTKRHKNLLNFDDFCDCIETSAGTPKLASLQCNDFRLWRNEVSFKKKDVQCRPHLRKIRAAKFSKGCTALQYKLDLSEQTFKQCPFMKESDPVAALPPKLTANRGLELQKARDIKKKLCPLMPLSKRQFWNNLAEDQHNMDLQAQKSEVSESSESDLDNDDDLPSPAESRGSFMASACSPRPSRPSYPLYEGIDPILAAEGRRIEYTRGDGNCFFRAISRELDGSEVNHGKWRDMVCNTISSQPQLFEQYVGTTIDDHLRDMRQLGRWATTCELYAIATCLGRHLYVFSPHPGQGDNAAAYRWLGFPPQEEAVEVVGGHDESVHPRYITLCHTHANHFDRIRPLLAGCNCEMQPPRLAGEEATMDLT